VNEPKIGVRPLNEPDHGVMVGNRLIAVCPDREKADLVVAGLRALHMVIDPAVARAEEVIHGLPSQERS
jgi:hypothetical protein